MLHNDLGELGIHLSEFQALWWDFLGGIFVLLGPGFRPLLDVSHCGFGAANSSATVDQHWLRQFLVGVPNLGEIAIREARSPVIGRGHMHDSHTVLSVVGKQTHWKGSVP